MIFVLPAACRARWISNLSWLRNLFLQILQRPTCDFHLFLQAFLQRVFLLEISNCDRCSTWVKFTEFEVCLSIPKLNRALPSGCRTQVAWEKNSSCGISLPASSKKRLEKGSRRITNCSSLKRSRGTLAVPWKLPHLHKNWIVRGRRHKNQSIISSSVFCRAVEVSLFAENPESTNFVLFWHKYHFFCFSFQKLRYKVYPSCIFKSSFDFSESGKLIFHEVLNEEVCGPT